MKLKPYKLFPTDDNTPVGFYYNVDYKPMESILYQERDRLYLDLEEGHLTLSKFDDSYDYSSSFRSLTVQGTDRLYKYLDVLTLYAYIHKEYGDTEPFYVFINEMLYEIKDLLPKDFL